MKSTGTNCWWSTICHPQYASTAARLEFARRASTMRVQHHRAHIASVLAEREAWDERVVGVSFDGTGYGDDGTIWGGEFFVGSVAEGFPARRASAPLPFCRAAMRPRAIPSRRPPDSSPRWMDLPDLTPTPVSLSRALRAVARSLSQRRADFRLPPAGRLFDTAAALLGFTRPISFEGQAAMWLEHLARGYADTAGAYPFPLDGEELDFRPLLQAVIEIGCAADDPGAIARAFHRGVAQGLSHAVRRDARLSDATPSSFPAASFKTNCSCAI